MCTTQIPICRCYRCLDFVKLGRRDLDKYSYATEYEKVVDCGSEKCASSKNHRDPCHFCYLTCKHWKKSQDIEVSRQYFLCDYCKVMAPREYQALAWRKN